MGLVQYLQLVFWAITLANMVIWREFVGFAQDFWVSWSYSSGLNGYVMVIYDAFITSVGGADNAFGIRHIPPPFSAGDPPWISCFFLIAKSSPPFTTWIEGWLTILAEWSCAHSLKYPPYKYQVGLPQGSQGLRSRNWCGTCLWCETCVCKDKDVSVRTYTSTGIQLGLGWVYTFLEPL